MKKHVADLLFNEWMERIIINYGDEDLDRKIEFVKEFIRVNFQVDRFDNSYIKIERMHSKTLMWLLVDLMIDYEILNQNPNEQSSKLSGLGDLTFQKIKIPDKMGMQEKFKSLEVQDIFLVEELTPEDVEFIEQFLEKTNVDLESGTKFFIISTNQIIYLLRKIMRDYHTFLSNGKKSEE